MALEVGIWLARGLRELGAPSEALERVVASGLPRIGARAVGDAWAEALAATQDPLLGLRLGTRAPIGAFGILDFVAGSATTLGEALRDVVSRFELVSDACALDLLVMSEEARVVLRSDLEEAAGHQAALCLLTVIVTRARELTTSALVPLRVSFAGDRFDASSLEAIRDLFGCDVSQNASRTQIVFARSALDLPLVTAAPSVHALLAREVRVLTGSSSLRRRVEEAIGANLDEVSLDGVACTIGMSRRTLQRKLASEGTVFEQVVDDLRRERALALLRDDRLSIAQVAARLGFADASAFYRAFRRWTGGTPRAFRGRVA